MKKRTRKLFKNTVQIIAIIFIGLFAVVGVGLETKALHRNDMADYYVCYYDISVVKTAGEPDKWVCVNSTSEEQECIKACYYAGTGGLQ